MTTEHHVIMDLPVHAAPTLQGERALGVDLYLPLHQSRPTPLVIYIHGGGWYMGAPPLVPQRPYLHAMGIAVAAITYRYSIEMPFPAMLHDCKTMVRFLRAKASAYNLDTDNFGVWGISAGGHLAPLLALTANMPELEGDGPYQGVDTSLKAVCSTCGVTDLWRAANDPDSREDFIDMLNKLTGGPILENEKLAQQASPLNYVSAECPPHLFIHGLKDDLCLPYHSEGMHAKLQEAGVESTLVLVEDADHNIPWGHWDKPVADFFAKHLKGKA